MTLDEAQLVLNVKRSDGLEQMLKVYTLSCFSFGIDLSRVLELRTLVQGQFTPSTR